MITPRWKLLLACVATAMGLVSCGGGGGSSGTTDPGPAPASKFTVSGTAASGVAAGTRPVAVQCAAGSGSTTTAADGTFSIEVTGTLPCVLRVTLANGSFLHSVAVGNTAALQANITPATQLIVAGLVGGDPGAFFAGFDAATAGKLTTVRLALAQAAVITLLKDAGIDFSALGDLVSGALVAGVTPGAGNAYDTALDALLAALNTNGIALSNLTTAVVTAVVDVVNGTPAANAVAFLPSNLLLRPAATTCNALRSGNYRIVTPTAGATIADQSGLMSIDARTLGIVYPDARTGTLAPATAPCRFTTDAGATDVVVSQAGVIAWNYSRDGGVTHRMAVAFPEQTIALAALAGTWNMIGMGRNAAGGYTGVAATGTLDAAGGLSAVTYCQDDANWSLSGAACTARSGPFGTLQANANGGFDLVDPNSAGPSPRAFVYKPGNGDLMMVKVDPDGSFDFRTRQRTQALQEIPAIGLSKTNWNIYTAGQLLAPSPIDERTNTTKSVDAATQSYVRVQLTPGTNNAHDATLFINNPRAGYLYRPQGTALAANGTTVNINEFVSLGMRGTGVAPSHLTRLKWFDLSVLEP